MTRDAMIEKLNGAHKAMTDAVQRQWQGQPALNLSIPARPDHDTDFLVCDPIREALAALRSRPAPPDDLDGPRLKTKLDEQYAKALAVINQQREEIERLKAAPPDHLVALGKLHEAYRHALSAYRNGNQSHGDDMNALHDYYHQKREDLLAWSPAAPAPVAAPCPSCVSERGTPDANCTTCHGSGRCPSAPVAAPAPETRVSYSCPHCGREYDRPVPAPETPAPDAVPEVMVGDLVRISLSIVWGARRDWRIVEIDRKKVRVRHDVAGSYGEWTQAAHIDEIERNGVVIWRRQEAQL